MAGLQSERMGERLGRSPTTSNSGLRRRTNSEMQNGQISDSDHDDDHHGHDHDHDEPNHFLLFVVFNLVVCGVVYVIYYLFTNYKDK